MKRKDVPILKIAENTHFMILVADNSCCCELITAFGISASGKYNYLREKC